MITVLSLAPLIGEAIKRIHTGQSVGELFHEIENEVGNFVQVGRQSPGR